MNILDAITVSLADLYFRRFRTALATLGIVFGVAAVQAMLCIGEGAKQEALAGIGKLGVDKVFLRTELVERTKSEDGAAQEQVERPGLLLKDCEHMRDHIPGVERIAAARILKPTLFSIHGIETPTTVVATNASYQKLVGARMVKGRFLSAVDEELIENRCVLGKKAARALFLFQDPLGQHVNLYGQPFTVVGILDNVNDATALADTDIDEVVFIPLSTAIVLSGDPLFDDNNDPVAQIDAVMADLESPKRVQPVAMRLRRWLQKENRIGDITMEIPLAILKQQESTKRIFSLVMTTIAGISLLVGGIGIMNIMLANVSERRREIGTRRALGARQRDILFQFCFEASVLSAFGGLLGIAVGYGLTLAVAHYAGWPVLVTLGNVSVGFIAAVVTGVVFGYWPAKQAAQVVPIEALRSA